ncbi:MAG: hypothetical protein AVDCRST_MAG02-4445, partial [uncultured Rubrobacteraceae bacterium]
GREPLRGGRRRKRVRRLCGGL